jgi:protoporphyrinogen/coproporphyrinogen III oxidase
LSAPAPKRVAVIGGGITGLAAAFRLMELAAVRAIPLQVTLFERGARLGGALDTTRRDGFVIETGADSFLSEKPAAAELAKRLGLENELIGTNPRFRKTYVVRGGRLVAIPEGFSLLAPARLGPVLKSPLLSPIGKLRLAMEPLIPRRRATGDESLGSFVRRRMGAEVLDRIAQALAGGIYTADPDRLSLGATMPRFIEMERVHGSVIRGLKAANRNRPEQAAGTSGARYSLFLSFRGGMRTLVDALAARLGECVRMGTEVLEICAAQGSTWRLSLPNGADFETDAIVLAAPAQAASRMLMNVTPSLANALGQISYASAATVNLAYRIADFPRPPETFGFVVPVKEGRRIIAGSFSSVKFAGRAPEGTVLLRVFLGGALNDRMMRLDEAAMVGAAREEVLALLGVRAEPRLTLVRRWPDSMPQYAVGHLARVTEIERLASALPGLALAGAAYRGVGIPDCIRSGELAAESVVSFWTRTNISGAG